MVGTQRQQEPGPGHMENQPRLFWLYRRTSNKSLSQNSVISKLSGSRQDSKSPKPRKSTSLSLAYIKTVGSTRYSGQSRLWFGWRCMAGGIHVQINRSSLAQSSCWRTDWGLGRISSAPSKKNKWSTKQSSAYKALGWDLRSLKKAAPFSLTSCCTFD